MIHKQRSGLLWKLSLAQLLCLGLWIFTTFMDQNPTLYSCHQAKTDFWSYGVFLYGNISFICSKGKGSDKAISLPDPDTWCVTLVGLKWSSLKFYFPISVFLVALGSFAFPFLSSKRMNETPHMAHSVCTMYNFLISLKSKSETLQLEQNGVGQA